MTASQQPDAEHAPLTSPATAGSGSTGHDKAVSLVAQKINDALVEATAEHLAGQGPPDTAWFIHEAQASAAAAIAALRAALAAGDPDVAEALGLSEQVRGCDHGFIHPDPDLPQVWSSNVPCPTADQRRFVTDWTEVSGER